MHLIWTYLILFQTMCSNEPFLPHLPYKMSLGKILPKAILGFLDIGTKFWCPPIGGYCFPRLYYSTAVCENSNFLKEERIIWHWHLKYHQLTDWKIIQLLRIGHSLTTVWRRCHKNGITDRGLILIQSPTIAVSY